MLEIRQLSVRYGGVSAVRQASLDIAAGEIVALVGANGAGKSSIMKAVSGLVQPSAGSIRLAGEEIAGMASHRVMARGVALCPEGRMILGTLSVADNLRLAAPRRRSFDDLFQLFPRLAERSDRLAAGLSGGEAQMLAIARALARGPKLLLLDEPSLGLSPLLFREIFHLIHSLREQGLTILLVEQNVRQALKIADRAYVLAGGTISLEGRAADLLHDERISDAYLGLQREE